MKATSEKSSSTSSTPASRSASRPFFARAGGGDFFAPLTSTSGPAVQAKLTVNQPGDKFEQEADKMATKVMRLPTPASPATEEKLQKQPDERLQTAPVSEDKLQRQTEEKLQKAAAPEEKIQQQPEEKLQRQAEEKLQKAELPEEKVQKQEEEKLQTAANPDERIQRRISSNPPAVTPAIQSGLRTSLTGGQPLASEVRSYMEPRFQADFSNVRVHRDPEAAGLSQQLSARAFTYQSHIFFSRDQYQPGTSEGRQLLAHELTHTLQQGAATRRKAAVTSVSTPQVQRGVFDWIEKGVEWIKSKLKRTVDRAADAIVPGYMLLKVILGKNIITDEPVPRTGANIIRGYMRLTPLAGDILLSQLEETNTLSEAGVWAEAQVAKFGINFNDLAKRLELMWAEMSGDKGIDGNIAIFKKYISPVLLQFMAFSGVVMDKVKELSFEGALRLVGATQLLAAMKKDPGAFKRLVNEPKLILKYFMDALKQGFSQFKDNFVSHFKNALFGWLFGKAAEMGIEMPKEFNAAGLFHLIAQLIGVTYRQIRKLVVEKLGPRGEAIVSTVENTVQLVKDLVVKGPIALWERVQSFLSNLKEMVFGKISELVSFEIIKAAVVKLVSMLNPVGAIVQLVLGIYRVVKFFLDHWDTIKAVTNAILDSITQVALGNIAAAANFIEKTMAKGITLIISFLAGIFGLSGIVTKVRALIQKISDPVQLAIGRVADWIVEKGKALFKKLFGKKDKTDKKKGDFRERAKKEMEKKFKGKLTVSKIQGIVEKIYNRYRAEGLKGVVAKQIEGKPHQYEALLIASTLKIKTIAESDAGDFEIKTNDLDLGWPRTVAGAVLQVGNNIHNFGVFRNNVDEHAEEQLINSMKKNWKKINIIEPKSTGITNNLTISITRSPCGKGPHNCAKKINEFISNKRKQYKVNLILRITSLYYGKDYSFRRSSERAIRMLKGLKDVEVLVWDIVAEIGDNTGDIKKKTIKKLKKRLNRRIKTFRKHLPKIIQAGK